MKEKGFNLSEFIAGAQYFKEKSEVIDADKVKEFIKIVNDFVYNSWKKKQTRDELIRSILEELKKRAGDKLI